jgi:Derlin-2/3
MQFVMQLFMLVQYSSRYELSPFNTGGGGSSADYLLMLVFGAAALLLLNCYLGYYVLGGSLVSMVTYLWSCREPHALVSFWGFTLQAMYLPWALAALSFLMGGTSAMISPLMGIGVGHLYYFLIETLPLEYDVDLLKTPEFFVEAFEGQGGGRGGRGEAAGPGGAGQSDWGTGGRVLGGG